MYDKEILIKHLTETLNEEKAKQMPTNVKTRQTRNINLDKIYHQKQETDLLHFKTLKMKCQIKSEELQRKRNITTPSSNASIYNKQNHRPNPVTNHFPENDNSFWQQRTVPGNSKYSDAVRNGKKTFIVGTSMVKGMVVSWSNIKTSEVLYCPLTNRRNPRQDYFAWRM